MSTQNAVILSEQPWTEPTVVELPAGVLVVKSFHQGLTIADLPRVFDAGYSALAAAQPIGPGYALYFGDPMATFGLEIGFPVAADPEIEGLEVSEYLSGPALALTHRGSYESMGQTWGRLAEAFLARGGTMSRSLELYVTDPSATATDDLRTDLFLPLG